MPRPGAARPAEAIDGDWKVGLFSCYEDPRLCIYAFCVPCYVVGRNAQDLGDDCLLYGIAGCGGCDTTMRWRIREKHGIPGSMLMDLLTHTVCWRCAIYQEAKQYGLTAPSALRFIGRE